MSLISVTCSQTLPLYSSDPPHTALTNPLNSLLPSTSIPASTLKLSPYSQTFLRNGNSVISRRNRFQFHVHSGDSDADTNESTSTSLLSFLCPLLKLFSAGDPSQERNFTLEVATSSLSTLVRFPWGSRSLSKNLDSQEITTLDPPMRLQLFEFEACPFCRRVREAMTELDLSAEVYPCPKGSLRYRELVNRSGGKEQFPFLIDPNTGISMYESGEIVRYLFQQYGKGRKPSLGLLESTLLTGWMPTIFRAGRGMTLWERARVEPPPKKLELYSYENNPYARIVREALCELELPYILQNVGEGSLRSKLLVDASGSKVAHLILRNRCSDTIMVDHLMQWQTISFQWLITEGCSITARSWSTNAMVPYLIDPNTGTHVGDYKKILSYLFQTYSVAIV